MGRRALVASSLLVFALSCRNVLGLGDPLPYEPDAGGSLGPNGEQPVVTEDSSACGGANLVVDANHCGRCNHSCRGSRCERGKCIPAGVIAPTASPFAVFDQRVFTFTSQGLVRVEANGEAFLVAATAVVGAQPRTMIANAQHVVWSGDDGVRVCSTTGCPADGAELLSVAGKRTGPVVRVAAVHPTFPYVWVNFSDLSVEKYGGTAPLSTGPNVESALCPSAFAEVDGGAYLSDAPGKRFWLYRATEQGRIAATADDECAIAASGNNVYYTDASSVWRTTINPDGSLAPRIAIASGLVTPKALATDDEFVYWAASSAETAIVRCKLTGCEGPPQVVVDAIPPIESLVVDGPFVYFGLFLNETLGRIIYKVAK